MTINKKQSKLRVVDMTGSHCCIFSALLLLLRKVSWIVRFAERYCGADFPNAECQHKGEKSKQNQTHRKN